MIIVTGIFDLPRIANSAIRKLVTLRLQQLVPNFVPGQDLRLIDDATPATPYEFVVVEGGDAVSEIEQAAVFPILHSLFDDLPFGHPDFYPCYELLEKHQDGQFYEMVFIGNDDGAATCILIPDQEGIEGDLLVMCRSFATPAMNTP
jgi:hypothetical protein